jgi:hypothetical protein
VKYYKVIGCDMQSYNNMICVFKNGMFYSATREFDIVRKREGVRKSTMPLGDRITPYCVRYKRSNV